MRLYVEVLPHHYWVSHVRKIRTEVADASDTSASSLLHDEFLVHFISGLLPVENSRLHDRLVTIILTFAFDFGTVSSTADACMGPAGLPIGPFTFW